MVTVHLVVEQERIHRLIERLKTDHFASAMDELVQAGTRLFLVKVLNHAHVTAELNVESPNGGNVYIGSTGNPAPPA